MKLNKLGKAIIYPLADVGVLMALIVFALLVALAGRAGMFGLWLLVLIVPAVFRYQIVLLEARARGRDPRTPGPEFFSLTDNSWSLFPVVIVFAIAALSYFVLALAGVVIMLAFIAAVGAVYPAVLGVLAITHSPLQSVNPINLMRFIDRCGHSYWIAPFYLLLITILMPFMSIFSGVLSHFVEMFLLFSLHSVIGSLIEPYGLMDDVRIPDDVEPDSVQVRADLDKQRGGILGHAYGLISRGNRDGGFKHITDWISEDPEPAAAWAWFFDRMLTWEQKQHALFFAQHYIHDMLRHGEEIPSLKVIMRCRLIDERFKPFAADLPAAIGVAERHGNSELAAVLRR